MKLVYILEQFYLHGGIERVTANKVNWLVNNGFDVTIISNNQEGRPKIYSLDPKVEFIDLGVDYIKNTSYFNIKNLFKAPKHIYKLKKILDSINPDVIIDLSLQFDYYALPFITRAKTIREFHSSRYYYDIERKESIGFFRSLIYKLNDFIENKYTYNIVLNEDEKQHYKSDNLIVIPNGLKIDSNKHSNLKSKTAISAGRIAPVKGFDKLIDAWSLVHKKYPDWNLHIYGNGDVNLLKELESKIMKLGLEKTVCLCGQTDYLANKMLNSSIFIMSSLTECFPMVLLEAKNMGLPIVSFDCPYGPRNIINNKQDGLIVENQNIDALYNGIVSLIESKDRRLEYGNMAKQDVNIFELTNIMKQWKNLFVNIKEK